jgi:hypothetical protein
MYPAVATGCITIGPSGAYFLFRINARGMWITVTKNSVVASGAATKFQISIGVDLSE